MENKSGGHQVLENVTIKGVLWSDRTALYPDYGCSDVSVCMCLNS